MPEKEDFRFPKLDDRGLVIPDLKKEEKERKKAGAAWGQAKPGGAPFAGARGAAGGARAAASAARASASATRVAASAVRAAAVGEEAAAGAEAAFAAGAGGQAGFFATIFGQVEGVLASLTSTVLGKIAVAVAVALMMGGAALLAYKIVGRAMADASAPPDLAGISSNLKIRPGGGDSSLDYDARAGRGLGLDFGNSQGQAVSPSADAPSGADAAQNTKDANNAGTADMASNTLGGDTSRDKMAHNLSGFKLSTELGGSAGSGGNVAGSNGTPYGAASGVLDKFGMGGSQSGKGGKLSAVALNKTASMGRLEGKAVGGKRGLASGYLARLRGMAPFNAVMRSGGTSVATESNAAAASTQWEASQVAGGTIPSGPSLGGSFAGGGGTQTGGGGTQTGGGQTPSSGGTSTGGGTVPGVTQTPYVPTIEKCNYDAGEYWDGKTCTSLTPNSGKHANVTPWQGMVDAAKIIIGIISAFLLITNVIAIAVNTFGLALGPGLIAAISWLMTYGTYIAGVLGVAITALGLYTRVHYGQPLQGNIMMAAGGCISAAATIWVMLPYGEVAASASIAMAVLGAAAAYFAFF